MAVNYTARQTRGKVKVTMALIFIMVLVCVADYTLGADCTEGQHCSQCDMEGNCLHGCDKGYFGMKCKSQCNSKCRYNTCKLDPGTGAGKCTDGCEPGYQGKSCDRPYDSHVVNCTLCPGGCDGEYCQLGDACFAGCRDSRYGSGCKTCPSSCRTCNRMTGVCDECDPTHHGVNCEMTCENCAGSCEAGCECVPGFYGDFCAETCSKTCRPRSPHTCLPAVTSDSCTGECHKHSASMAVWMAGSARGVPFRVILDVVIKDVMQQVVVLKAVNFIISDQPVNLVLRTVPTEHRWVLR
ncbi:multiple epidermal growth factor-like domains protein 6 [Haliotis rubra]|uniref:multiple epidermal growth factor-like domains protein 6 n=1 Tax=Haliotis rubra TaxID=36100 RepID=UPI001EE534C8|nr:multiple epidermal growth factor-like domains protein 6 [Haliotis rubra]